MSKTYQPLIRHEGIEPLAVGDRVLCEAGHLFGTVKAVGDWGWPILDLEQGQVDPTGQLLPIKCKCGAVAIVEKADFTPSNTTQARRE